MTMGCRTNDTHEDLSVKKTIITGKVMDHDKYPNTRYVSVKRSEHTCGSETIESIIASDGTFRLETHQNEPEIKTLYPFQDLSIYTLPGDSIYLEIYIDNQNNILFSGNRASENTKLHDYFIDGFSGSNMESDAPEVIMNSSPQEFLERREGLKDNAIKALNKFRRDYKPNNFLSQALEARILNKHYSRLYEYGRSNCSILNQTTSTEIKMREDFKFYSVLEEAMRKDAEKIFNHHSYDGLLNEHTLYLMELVHQEKIEDLVKRGEEWQKNASIDIITDHEKHPLIKERMLFKYAERTIENRDFNTFENLEQVIDETIIDQKLKASLQHLYYTKKTDNFLAPLDQYDTNTLKEESTLIDSLLSRHKGQVVYIDLWANWCKPCLNDMIASKSYIENMYKSKEVAFIYLALGSNPEECEDFITEHSIPGSHKYLSKEEAFKINNFLNNTSLPYQAILNQKGELIKKGHYSLTRSSTRKIIDGLLIEI